MPCYYCFYKKKGFFAHISLTLVLLIAIFCSPSLRFAALFPTLCNLCRCSFPLSPPPSYTRIELFIYFLFDFSYRQYRVFLEFLTEKISFSFGKKSILSYICQTE